jgi:LysM repeat protein
MRRNRTLTLTLCALASAFATLVCSSGYITPGSLAETEEAQANLSASATALSALLVGPTQTLNAPVEIATAIPSAETQPSPEISSTPAESPTAAAPYVYTAQSGDTLSALAARFGVQAEEIASPQNIPPGLIPAGQILTIPNVLGETSPQDHLLPDSEVVFSPSAIGFVTATYIGRMGGYLATYREYLPSSLHTGADVVDRVAYEHSLNPRLLLSVLQEQSNWVLGEAQGSLDYPMGYLDPSSDGLYAQLSWAARQLSIGYYGWREGRVTELVFPNGQTLRLAPDLNAGTVAIQYLFSKLHNYEEWLELMDPDFGFAHTHGVGMFPDPWVRAAEVEPLFPADLAQTEPHMSLPFYRTQIWYYTGGPHGAWEREGAQAALDFAPSSTQSGCAVSEAWITAASEGLVVRAQPGLIMVDWDGDANEQTGWVILYLHVSHNGAIKVGDFVNRGQQLGHPSCEGGRATDTHVHIARKYNGEWIGAAGPVPMILSGWVVQSGGAPYLGSLVRGDQTIIACTCSSIDARIARSADDPY